MKRIWLIALVTLALPSLAAADKRVPVPTQKSGDKLEMRVVRYTGGTNGEMVVEVVNRGTSAATFAADGMYFVPQGDPESAPQRLGAAGPMQVAEGGTKKAMQSVVLAPGETKQIDLQVFCIDSHRSSPQATHKFDVAPAPLPAELRREIKAGSQEILHQNRGDVAKSKSAIQNHVWSTRNKKWIKLDGERAAEKSNEGREAPHVQQRLR